MGPQETVEHFTRASCHTILSRSHVPGLETPHNLRQVAKETNPCETSISARNRIETGG
jgi:hypothetical protein